jgi:hypothetical protein
MLFGSLDSWIREEAKRQIVLSGVKKLWRLAFVIAAAVVAFNRMSVSILCGGNRGCALSLFCLFALQPFAPVVPNKSW